MSRLRGMRVGDGRSIRRASGAASGETQRVSRLDRRRVFELARPEWLPLLLGTIALVVASAASLSAPALVGRLVDSVTGSGGRAALDRGALILLGVFAISGLAAAFRSYLFTVAGERIVARLRGDLYAAVIRQEIAFFDQRRTGELTNRLASDTTVLQNVVTVNLLTAMRFGLQGMGAIGILLWTSWKLTLVMLAVVPLVAIVAGFYGRILRRGSKDVQDALAASSEVAEETLAGVRTVRAFAREATEIRRYRDAVEESFQLGRHRAKLVAIFTGIMSFAGFGAIAAVLWYGVVMLSEGALGFGQLTSFLLYTFTVAFSIMALSGLWSEFARAAGASERVFELIDRQPTVSSEGRRLGSVQGAVQFDGLGLAIPRAPIRRSWKVSVCRSIPVEWWRWSVRRVVESRPRRPSCAGSTILNRGRFCWTVIRIHSSMQTGCASKWVSSVRNRSCLRLRCATTFVTAASTRAMPRCRQPRWPPTPTHSSVHFPRATQPWWGSGECAYRRVKSNALPSPAPCSRTRRSLFWTRPPVPWMPRVSTSSKRPWSA